MKWRLVFLAQLVVSTAYASPEGANIYLQGKDQNNLPITVTINDLESSSALACSNCHRESGLGTSESGKTIPPVSWQLLSQNQPSDNHSRFYSLQNKRPAYNLESLHRLLTMGINSSGNQVDPLMPKYRLTPEQTRQLASYLKSLYANDDPGVDGETITIATVIDRNMPEGEKAEHIKFMQGLFDMKNSQTRGELKRKKYSPIQKVPQYESYRKWDLVVWELPEDPGLWKEWLEQAYSNKPVFVVLAPLVSNNITLVQEFCSGQQIPCLFPNGSGKSGGNYYNYVFKNSSKQQTDFIASQYRKFTDKLFFLSKSKGISRVQQDQAAIPPMDINMYAKLEKQFQNICYQDITLLLLADRKFASKTHQLKCESNQNLNIKLMPVSDISYRDIVDIRDNNSSEKICWITDYDKVLKQNMRKIRVSVLARKFGMLEYGDESLAKDLFAFGILSDSIHQLAGVFSRRYLLEILEHMLNSYPNFTYYSSISGAPYQRSIVGPYREYCPDEERA